MSRIDAIFADLRARNERTLMPFLTAGYPSIDTTVQLLPVLEAQGTRIVELGFPFSDPIADGPTIVASMHHALEQGVTPQRIFEAVGGVRSQTSLGLIAMVSFSILARMGPDRFIADAAAAGFDGLIVPDLDTNAAPAVVSCCDQHDLAFTLLIAPSTSEERIARIASLCRGFIYVLARTGITGEQATLELPGFADRLALIRRHTTLPLAVGFGISTPEHVRLVTAHADAAIVGSAVVRRLGDPGNPIQAVKSLVGELQTGLAAPVSR